MLPVEEVLRGPVEYKPPKVIAPALVGWKLKLFVYLEESSLFGNLIKSNFLKLNHFPQILRDAVIPDTPMYLPEYPTQEAPEASVRHLDEGSNPVDRVATAVECLPAFVTKVPHIHDESNPFLYWTIRDYAEAYSTGRTTPTEVAERFIAAVEESKTKNPPLTFFISFIADDVRKQAKESTERHANGKSLSILDGILLAVKDDVDCLPHPSTVGTKWMAKVREVKDDAVCVARLRQCGMIMVGKAVMHELGMGTTGNNPIYGTARNPHDVTRYTGGSSSGSTALVSSGLCPVALGTDVGGSIRVPSSLCGVVGLKPTFGRTTNHGLATVGWSMESCGPIAATTEDALLVYAAMLGRHPNDRLYSQPLPPCLPMLNETPHHLMSHVKLGKYPDWFNFTLDKQVLEVCNKSLELVLEEYGTETKGILLPELEELRIGHLATVGSEYAADFQGYDDSLLKELCYETRATLSFFKCFTASDFLAAQKIRRRAMYFHMQAFKTVDVIVSPTTASSAPVIPLSALSVGESDLQKTGDLMRFVVAPNFLGLPAISVPVGHDSKGLPIGLHLIGRPWQEATLLRVAKAFELICAPLRNRPSLFYDLLGNGKAEPHQSKSPQ